MTPQELHELAKATDTELARLYDEQWRLITEIDMTSEYVAGYVFDRRERDTDDYITLVRHLKFGLGIDLESGPEIKRVESYYRDRFIETVNKLKEYHQKLDTNKEQQKPLKDLFYKHRWSRFFLVCASNGHIHKDMDCHTCYDTTRYMWLPKLSGLTEEDAVNQEGEILCTICFPTAPVNWTNGVSRRDQEKKAQREREKQERLAKKLEKALMPDGNPLVIKDKTDRWKEYLNTVATAKKILTEYFVCEIPRLNQWQKYTPETANLIADAIANKLGITREEVIAEATKKAQKKARTY